MTTITISDDLHKMIKSKVSELRLYDFNLPVSKVVDVALRIGLNEITIENIIQSDNI